MDNGYMVLIIDVYEHDSVIRMKFILNKNNEFESYGMMSRIFDLASCCVFSLLIMLNWCSF